MTTVTFVGLIHSFHFWFIPRRANLLWLIKVQLMHRTLWNVSYTVPFRLPCQHKHGPKSPTLSARANPQVITIWERDSSPCNSLPYVLHIRVPAERRVLPLATSAVFFAYSLPRLMSARFALSFVLMYRLRGQRGLACSRSATNEHGRDGLVDSDQNNCAITTPIVWTKRGGKKN